MVSKISEKLLIASNNPKKIKEIKEILSDFFDEFVTFKDYNLDSPEENGSTFVENSLIKARFGASKTSLITLADDSGLCVDHLNGNPGVYSARYAVEGDDIKNYQKLLENLKDVPFDQRDAFFESAIALVYPNGQELVTQGRVHGVITFEPQGENGFGYDPIFFIPKYNCTMAQLPAETKNIISHRGVALKKLKEKLEG